MTQSEHKNDNNDRDILCSIVDAITGDLTIDEIKKYVVDKIGTTFNCNRCFIRIFENSIDSFELFDSYMEYRSSPSIKTLTGDKFNEDMNQLLKKNYKLEHCFHIKSLNDLKVLTTDEQQIVKDFFNRYDIKSNYCFPVLHKGELIGALVLHYTENNVSINNEDVALLKIIAKHVLFALKQDELHQNVKKQAIKEELLRKITETIKYNDKLENALSVIAREVAEVFKVQRVHIIEMPENANRHSVFRAKYCDNNISTRLPDSFLTSDQLDSIWKKKVFLNDNVWVVNDIGTTNAPEFFKEKYKKINSKSILAVGIKKGENKWGVISLHSVGNCRTWTKEEINLLKIVADQIYFAIKQAELFEIRELSAKRERLIRDISTNIRSFLSIKKIKRAIVNELGRILNADRVLIAEFDPAKNNFTEVDEFSEYLSDPNIKSSIDIDLNSDCISFFSAQLAQKQEIILYDSDKYIIDNRIEGTPAEKFLLDFEVKSAIGLPICGYDQFLGAIAIHFKKKMAFTDNDVVFIKTLVNQIGIALYQSKLYDIVKQTAEREKLLRKVTSTITNSLDINETLATISTEISSLLSVSNIIIKEPSFDSAVYSIKSESILDNINFDSTFIKEFHPGYESPFNRNFSVVVNDINDSSLSESLKNSISTSRIASFLSVPIKKENEIWGYLFLFDSTAKNWSTDDISIVESIADQIYLAVKQVELYTRTRKQAEREILLRSIIESIRSSLDINSIKKNIVEEVQKVFKADRCFIRMFNEQKDEYLPIETVSEKLSSNEISSILDLDHNAAAISIIKSYHKRNIPTIIYDCENINPQIYDGSEIIKAHCKNFNVKSNYGLPIINAGKLLGSIILHYTKQNTRLSCEDIGLLRVIAYQAGIALNQAKMYEKAQQQADRENRLRKITETIRSSLDINETLTIICDEVGKLFNVQRAAISEFSDPQNYGNFVNIREYKLSPDVKGLRQVKFDPRVTAYIATKPDILTSPIMCIDDIENADIPDYMKKSYLDMGVKSLIITIIKNDNDLWGGLFLSEYGYNRHWTEDEILLLQTIADQLYIAIKQTSLYSITKKQAERETLVRNITDVIRRSLNINEVKNSIVTQIGKTFEADRCVIHQLNSETGDFYPIDEHSQYLSSEKIDSFVNVNIRNDFNTYLKNLLLTGNDFLIPDFSNWLDTCNEISDETKQLLKADLIKSSYIFPITTGEKDLGVLYITFIQERKEFSNDELQTLRILTNQIGIALNQANLYEIEKQTAEKEKLLRKLTSARQSCFEVSDILTIIAKEIAEYFNVQRVAIIDFKGLIKEQSILAEYKLQHIKSLHYVNPNPQSMDYWSNTLQKGSIKIINDFCNSDLPNELIHSYSQIGIKSVIGIALNIDNDKWGGIFLSDYIERRTWTDSEINFLKIISEYISVVIRENSLYNRAQFLTNVSHELKTPIAIINGYTEALINRDSEKSEMANKFLGVIKNNVDRMGDIINNLLLLSSLENLYKHKKESFVESELSVILEEAARVSNELASSKNINIQIQDNIALCLKCNPMLIQQAVINLINNAINYSDKNSTITVKTRQDNKNVLIKVIDSGCGIKNEYLDNIFERFYRVDRSRNRSTGGSGLGLSIVKAIAELHDGNVFAESIPDKGSIFTISLPTD